MKKLSLILIFFSIIIFFNVILTYSYLILGVKYYDIELEVNNNLGFNIDTDKLYFGTMPPGNIGMREIHIVNEEFNRVRINIKVFNELKDWVYVSNNNFILNKGEKERVKVFIAVPDNAEYKKYTSSMKITFIRF